MGILAWVVFGLIAGFLARFLMPGMAPRGLILTCLLGIIGAVVGGFIGTHVFNFGEVTDFNLKSFAIAVGGAVLVLIVYGWLRKAKFVT
jgi:uncharacterized membrane protein YeaQ/YmgE (transglycosylase-associated protein family)